MLSFEQLLGLYTTSRAFLDHLQDTQEVPKPHFGNVSVDGTDRSRSMHVHILGCALGRTGSLMTAYYKQLY